MDRPDTPVSTPLQRARNQVQLLELGAHFALAERAAKIGYWRHQIGEAEPHWSPGFFALMGLDPAVVRPSADFLMQRIHEDDRLAVALAVADAMSEGRPFKYRVRIDVGNGERIVDTYGDVERDADGKIVAVLGVVQEVTAEVTSERRLKESEAAYRFMTEEASDVISSHRADGTAVFVSPACVQMLGYEPEFFTHSPPLSICHPDDRELVRAAIDKSWRGAKTATYAYRARHRAGHYIWLESRVRFINDPATGRHQGSIVVSRDVTAHKRFEDELRAARERAEYASNTKSRFLANMSHELRTPLNAIIGFSDILAREMFGPIDNTRYTEYAKLINESGGMLLDLINDLLDMSKIEAGKFELHVEEFEASGAVESAVRLVAGRAEEKSIKIAVHIEPRDLRLTADLRAFKQILLNLLSNAVKFTNSGGKIALEARAVDGALKLVVRDNGIGIPADVLPRLARPFEQASSEFARAHGGSGLGLALVRSLTQMHGGDVAIASQEGRGTEVTVTIPLKPANAERAA